MNDIPKSSKKQKILDEAEKQFQEAEKQFDGGVITAIERDHKRNRKSGTKLPTLFV